MCWTCNVLCFFWLDPKIIFTQARQSHFSRFFLFFKPRFWLLHAMQVTSDIARRWRWGRCAVKHVLAFHILSPFFSTSSFTFFFQYVFNVSEFKCWFRSAAGSRKTDKICQMFGEQQAFPRVQTSDLDTVVLPKPEWQIRQKYINQHTFLFNGLCMQQASKTKAEQTTALASALTAAICTTNQLNTVKPRNYGRLSDEEEFLINVNSQIIAEY